MVWARARFTHDFVQHNKFNQVKVELFSKMSSSLKIASVALLTNVETKNKEVNLVKDDQPFSLTKF